MTFLTHAALLSVPVKGKHEDLRNLSLSSEAEIRQSRKKDDSMVAAKKYLKAMDALSELERAMAPFMGKQTHTSTQPPQKPKVLKPNLYQVVPYVSAAPIETVRTAMLQEPKESGTSRFWLFRHALDHVYCSSAWHWYRWLGWFCSRILLYAPLCLISAYLLYLALALLYVAAHPELLLRAVFTAVKSSPRLLSAYADHLGEAAWTEIKAAFSPF